MYNGKNRSYVSVLRSQSDYKDKHYESDKHDESRKNK